MLKSGAKPTRLDHRDYDYHKSFGSVAGQIVFPTSYSTDAGLTMPNQDVENDYFTPPVPALPYGCTDYTTSELATDFTPVVTLVKDPEQVEDMTSANANGGADVRTSLLAGKKLGWFTGIFNITAQDGNDMFDAIRTAMASGGSEKRSVSIGTPWFPIFESVDASGILVMPENFTVGPFTWHNWKICGWKLIGDQIYLVGKTWQGSNYGDKGFVYFSRILVNNLMAVSGSVAFTATTGTLPPITTISLSWLQFLLSYARSLFPY